MKRSYSFIMAVVAVFSLAGLPAFADDCHPSVDCGLEKPGLLAAADELTEALEQLDTALHEATAPEKTIQITHHFEEGLLEFVDVVRNGATCPQAVEEFQHFHEDIQLLYAELDANPALFYQDKVLSAWNTLLPAFVRFQNILY